MVAARHGKVFAMAPQTSLHQEDAAALLGATAADIDAVMMRTLKTLKRLETGQARPAIVRATRSAAESLARASHDLRRDGLLGFD